MGWERGYYYRVRKVRGRVVREYVGRGLIGELSAQIDADRRALREERQAALKAEIAELAELEGPVADLCRQTDLIVRAAMKAEGYRQYKRGEWRKKRGGANPSD